ncbi:hypothetical protein JQC91_01910 [Jannaschia sp. Os4]|uniref:hypothetical protein n=1 Tax=Jannaschia sp. Os4 TaxID=2807617 RepID=UPI001939A454|nr:hypothetical protein [Jannaschia sp. Os4]MBM2575048.1 hypothetical protein [Jannaschia sp. Os4]
MIRRGLLLGALALAGCGFEPAYGPGGADVLRGAVRADDPDNEAGFEFIGRIEARLDRPAAPRYALAYDISTRRVAIGIDGSNRITRYNVEGTVAWTLTAIGSETPLLQGTERSFTGYSVSGERLATPEPARDATRRLMIILADRVVARLLAGADAL